MPSEREIRKLYVNGLTICIEFFFCYGKFSASAGRAAVTAGGDAWGRWGVIPQQAFLTGRKPAKNRKHVHVCIACQYVKSNIRKPFGVFSNYSE